MSTSTIREGLRQMLAAADGIKSASGYPTENIGAVPSGQVGFDTDLILAGQLEQHTHTLPVTVLVARKGVLPNELKAVEDVAESVLAAIRSRTGFVDSQTIYGVRPTQMRQGVFSVAGSDYIGFEVTLDVTEKFNVTIGG